MKFRAVMRDPEFMKEFQNIISTLSKLTKECVMKISRDKVYFIANEEFGSSAPMVWVEIATNLYFDEFSMESYKVEDPNIFLTVSAINMCRALAVLRNNARYCKMKLTNIQFPCLSIESDVVSQNSEHSRQVVHDVPVSVVPRSDWSFYTVPEIPNCKITLTLPSYRLMRGLIDKIKNLSPNIIFYATSNGEMNVVAETEMTTITTRYKNLEVRSLNPSDEDKGKDLIEASCSVDCKKATIFLSALQVPTMELSCGIQDDHLIRMEINVRQGIVIHSILPAICL